MRALLKLLLISALGVGIAFAQDSGKSTPPAARAERKPIRTPDAVFGTTPMEAVYQLLEMAEVKTSDLVYDLGCGDGRIVVAAAKKYGAKGIGVDIDPKRVDESIENARTNKVEHLVTIKEADMFTVDLSDASVAILYLGPQLNLRLIPQLNKMKPGSVVISFDFDTPGVNPVEKLCGTRLDNGHEYTIYKYRVPLTVSESPKQN